MAFTPSKGLLVKDWKQDVIYLIHLPRTHLVPDPSPFAVKLETWIRMNGLIYKNISNELSKGSSKGQIPFIEINGRQFADSNQIIEHLRNHFKLSIDAKLNSMERANFRAYYILIEESLFRCLQYYRSIDFGWLFTDKGVLEYTKGIKKVLLQKFAAKKLQGRLKNNIYLHGYGRNSPMEIDEIAKKDLMAISTFLGDKTFLFGNSPTTLDATLFGHLVQLTDTPIPSQTIIPLLEKSAPNLLAFLQLIKRRYWPDWDEIIEKLILNPENSEENKEQK